MSEIKELKQAVLRLLSRREYSRIELERKFARKYAESVIDQVLSAAESDGYLSDKRYAECFVRHRIGQRYGLKRIQLELKHKGISDELVEHALDEAEPNWSDLAVRAWGKRFHTLPENGDQKEFAKQVRYLLQRGFSMDQVFYVLKERPDEWEDSGGFL